jgi:hypothetical protein
VDASKLSPAPWEANPSSWAHGKGWVIGGKTKFGHDSIEVRMLGAGVSEANAEFIALARNAFDVMLRRKWGIGKGSEGWFVSGILGEAHLSSAHADFVEKFLFDHQNPFEMLIEADAWYRANCEKEADL